MKPVYIGSTLIACLYLFVSIYFFIFGWADVLKIDNPIVIYWLDANNILLRLIFTCVVLPCLVLSSVLLPSIRKIISRFVVIATVILIFVTLIALIGVVPGILRDYKQQASIEFADRVYYALSSYGTVGIGDSRPLIDLYECDSFGFLCRKIYRNKGKSYSIPGNAHLIPDPATNTLSLEIDGEVVHTVQP